MKSDPSPTLPREGEEKNEEDDKMKTQYFNIKRDSQGTTIWLYGDIGYEVESGQIAAELSACEKAGGQIDVRINSNGGDVFSGIAIYNALKNSEADIHLYVDGVAASMASVIALCGKPVEMSKYARLMLHSVSGGCYGNKQELSACIQEIESLEDSLSEIYAQRMGLTKDAVKSRYFDGTDHWLRAEEALEMGLIDGIYDAEPVEDESSPEAIYKTFNNRLKEPQNRDNMTLEELKKQPQFTDCKSEEEVVARAQHFAALAGKAETLESENKELKEKVAHYEAQAEERLGAERKALLDAAEQDGRINAETRPTFENILKGNLEEGKKVLAALTPKRKVMNDLRLQPSGDGAWEQRMQAIREARAKRK